MRTWLVFLCVFFLIFSAVLYIKGPANDISVISDNETNIYVYDNNEASKWTVSIYDELNSEEMINLKITETGKVEKIDLYEYLRCVVASEMPGDYEYEALKAQAVVARTYLYKCINDNKEKDADICNSSSHCQAYLNKEEIIKLWRIEKGWTEEEISKNWAKINDAVISTDGIVAKYDSNLIEAYFHASSPIATESSSEIWGKVYYPYLVSVQNVEKEDYINRESEVEIDKGYFEDKIRENIDNNFVLNDGSIEIISYTVSGRVNEIKVNNLIISAEKMRVLFGLKSTLFTVQNNENSFVFHVIGYGHGVGMSQVGANYLALNGYKYDDILKYYYTSISVEKL